MGLPLYVLVSRKIAREIEQGLKLEVMMMDDVRQSQPAYTILDCDDVAPDQIRAALWWVPRGHQDGFEEIAIAHFDPKEPFPNAYFRLVLMFDFPGKASV